MDLSTYDGLKAGIAEFVNRDDLISAIPGFITLAESQMKRKLRTRRMVARADATFDAGQEYAATPGRMVGPRTLILKTNPIKELDYLKEEDFLAEKKADRFRSCPTADTEFYTLIGNELRFYPVPPVAYTAELTYFEYPQPLADANPSNWVLAEYPDLYLYGALTASAPYLQNDERTTVWGSLFVQGLADANAADPVPVSRARARVTDLPRGLGRRAAFNRS